MKNTIMKYKDEAIKILSDLISFETVLDEYNPLSDAPFGEENKKALHYLLNLAEKDGFVVKNVDNYAGHIEYGTGEEILGVLAHLDVVPVKVEEWTTYPFKLDIRDGKMYARGSMDDKGPLVASYIALKILKEQGFKPNKRIRLIAGCDEETGSRCLEHYLSKEEKPAIGFSPDAEFPLIYGEKGMTSYDITGDVSDDIIDEFICGDRYNIVPSYAKMKLKVDLKEQFNKYISINNYNGGIDGEYYYINGQAAHAMCPQNGINACYLMMQFLYENSDSKLAKFFNEYYLDDVNGKKIGYYAYDEHIKELTSNLAVLMIENNQMKIGVNCRVPMDSQFEVIESCVKTATTKYGYNYKILYNRPRHFVDPESDFIKTLLKCYQEVTNDYESKPITIGGGTYAREIGYAVAYGPAFVGREDVCHIANEYMYEEDFFNSIEIYLKAMYELCK